MMAGAGRPSAFGRDAGTAREVAELGRASVARYAAGSFGTGVFATIPTVLLLYYATETLAIAPGMAGLIILAPKLLSIVWDPVVGVRSDRSTSSWGRRRPFMLAGMLGMVLAFVILFDAPQLPAAATAAWVGVAYLALTLAYSLYAVPYIALAAELSSSGAGLARLVASRMIVVMVGILAGAALGPWLVQAGGGGRDGYAFMAWVIGPACLVVMAQPILMLHEDRAPPSSAVPAAQPFGPALRLVAGDAAFRRLAIGYLLQASAFGGFSAAVPYLVTRVLGRSEGEIGTALGAYLLATLLSVPLWATLGRRLTWRTALTLAAVGYAAGALLIGLIVAATLPWGWALIGFAVAGIPFAGLQVVPFTLLGDHIRCEAQAREGSFTGVWTAVEKLGLAIGPALVALALGAFGTADPETILWIAILPPTALSLASLFFRPASRP